MYLHEIVVDAEFSEEVTDSGGKLEDGLLGSGSQVNNSVVQTSFHLHDWSLLLFLLFLWFLLAFFFLLLWLLLFLFLLFLSFVTLFSLLDFYLALNCSFCL